MSTASESLKAPPALRAANVSKSYGHVQALKNVSLEAYSGEVLAIVGDNGAGKSTLVKVLAGVIRPDSGELAIKNSVPRPFYGPREAQAAGIATVFQDLALVEVLDVATNMFLGRTPHRGPFVDKRGMHNRAADTLVDLKIRLPSVRIPVGLLSGGQRQGVAVARAVLQGGEIFVMDEPTAALGVRETAQVVGIIGELRDQGKAVILISHDLEVVFEVADRVQVMRLGRRVGVRRTRDIDRSEVVGLITGTVGPDVIE